MTFIGLQTMTGKLLATAAVLGSTAAVASYGTFGTFTASTNASASTTAGTVALSLGTDATAANRLSVAATGIVPTDTIQRAVDLTNSGNQNLSTLTLTTSAPVTSSLLNTSAAMGLQVKVDRCSTAWTEAGVAPAYTYTCGGSTAVALASVPVIQSATALTNLTATTAGATDHLKITLTLPTGADNTLQGLSSVINFAFNGTQRAGTDK